MFSFNCNVRKKMVSFATTYCCTRQASHIKSALRRLRPDFSLICLASSGGRTRPSFLQTDVRTLQTLKNKKTAEKKGKSYLNEEKHKFQIMFISKSTPCPSHLFCARQRNSNRQTTAPNWPDDFGSRGGAENESAGGHVLFHRPTQSVLGILRQSVHLC